MRLDVSSQTEDTELLLIAPAVGDNGYADDVVGLRPVFGLDPVTRTGWWTVAISYVTFDDRIARFTLEYGRYPGGNLNCSQATATSAMAPAQLKPQGDPSSKAKTPPTE